jgi:hypothetical protein
MPVGKLLIAAGMVLIIAGLLYTYAGRLPFRLGHLPGDIYIQRNNTTFYFPLATCIVLSVIFTLILRLVKR